MTYDTIVLGAGIAGLAATRAIAEAGRRVLLLEAREEVGGRMRTSSTLDGKVPVELGAEFVHGRPPELLDLLQEAKLEIYETEGEQFCLVNGTVQRCPEDDGMWSLLDEMEEVARNEGDMSFDAYLGRCAATDAEGARVRSYVEGFNAADAGEIGILGLARQQAAEDAIEGHRAARVRNGYQALAEYVRDRAIDAGATLLVSSPVEQVQWTPGACAVQCAAGQRWEARQVICALPLGVFQGMPHLFTPAPQAAVHAAASLRAGMVQRIVFEFSERWWAPRQEAMHFLLTPSVHPPTWWTTSPRKTSLITAWIGGPRVLKVPDMAALAEQALHTLEKMFDRPLAPLLVKAHYVDWGAKTYARGAYSYAPAGAANAATTLAEPVASTLFFAGEHTDITGHPGTVHGALRSGLRAARQALGQL